MKRIKKPDRLLPTSRLGAVTRGELLARFLNEPVASLESARVAAVFQLCQQLSALEPSSRSAANTCRAINAHLQSSKLFLYCNRMAIGIGRRGIQNVPHQPKSVLPLRSR